MGGTHAHRVLIDRLKSRGYYTILVDYLAWPPCKNIADEHVQISTLDHSAVLQLARQRAADLVIATSVDQANVTACAVSEVLGLPIPYNQATARLIANKITMKRRLQEYGVLTPSFEVIHKLEDVHAIPLLNTVVVKPANCGGSKAVRKANHREELAFAAQKAFEAGGNMPILIEEFCEGDEYSADFFVQNGQAHLLLIRKKYIHNSPNQGVVCSYATMTPIVNQSSWLRTKVIEVAQKICSAFDLNSTALLLQFILRGARIFVLEFAPRIGGSLAADTIAHQTGFDVIDASIGACLNAHIPIAITPSSNYCCTHHVYAHPGVLGSINGLDLLLRDGVIDAYFIHKNKGDVIHGSFSSAERPCSFTIKDACADSILDKINIVFENMSIFDIHGACMLNKSIVLNKF